MSEEPGGSDASEKRTRRIDQWIRNNPLVLILALVAFLISTSITVSSGVRSSLTWWHTHHDWRETEYAKLTGLRAGYTIEKFTEVLGSPSFHRRSRRKKWDEYSFRGRAYWVQALTRPRDDTVQLYAVTSCVESFRPSFVLPTGETIRLYDKLREPRDLAKFSTADYFAPGATADAHFIEYLYLGNPGNYETFAWGFNDACLNLRSWITYLPASQQIFGMDGTYVGRALGGGPDVQAFRARVPINTYAETSPDLGFDVGSRALAILDSLQIGVDRIAVRTSPLFPKPNHLDTKPPRGTIRHAAGGAALQRAWQCFNKRLEFFAADRLNYTVDPHLRPIRPIWRATSGFIVVEGFFAPRRKYDFRPNVVSLGFERDTGQAQAVASSLRMRLGERVHHRGAVVVVWRHRPRRQDERVVAKCLGG